MPGCLVLHEGYSFTLRRLSDNRRRLSLRFSCFLECSRDCIKIMSVNVDYMEVECLELLVDRIWRIYFTDWSVNLKIIIIHNYYQVVQLSVRCKHGCFPYLPFLDFNLPQLQKAIGYDYTVDNLYRSPTHLNLSGAQKVTAYLGDYLADHCNVADVRGTQAAEALEMELPVYLDGVEADKIRGKNICLLDDVISTGESMRAMETLVQQAGANVVARAAVLAEGEAADRKDIIFLKKLPLFHVDEQGHHTELA